VALLLLKLTERWGKRLKALVTGGTGFIGSHLISYLLNKKARVKILVRKPDIAQKLFGKKVQLIQGDILDRPSLREAVNDVDVVFHLAAALGATPISHKEFFRVNAQGTENILKVCRKSGISRFVYCSTVAVSGDIKNPPANEEAPYNPDEIYEKSKCRGEEIALEFARKGLTVVVARPTWVYGPRDTRTLKLFRAIRRRRFIIAGKGTNLQHPVYVKDVAQGLYLCAQRDILKGEVFILGGNEFITVGQLINKIASLLGVELPSVKLPLWTLRPFGWIMGWSGKLLGFEPPLSPSKIAFFAKNRAYDISKAKRELGYRPKVNLERGLRQTLGWYIQNGYL